MKKTKNYRTRLRTAMHGGTGGAFSNVMLKKYARRRDYLHRKLVLNGRLSTSENSELRALEKQLSRESATSAATLGISTLIPGREKRLRKRIKSQMDRLNRTNQYSDDNYSMTAVLGATLAVANPIKKAMNRGLTIKGRKRLRELLKISRKRKLTVAERAELNTLKFAISEHLSGYGVHGPQMMVGRGSKKIGKRLASRVGNDEKAFKRFIKTDKAPAYSIGYKDKRDFKIKY